jgi:hypothetical protein
MVRKVQRMLMGVAAIAALALGGSALADAASSGSSGSSSSQTTATQTQQPPAGAQGYGGSGGPGGPNGGHVGANGQREVLLTGDTATKVKEAALAKVSGTVERVETDADHGSPYEAHIRKSDGTELEVLVNKNFEVTAVNTMQHP